MRDGKCPSPRVHSTVRGGRELEKQEIKIGSLKQLSVASEGTICTILCLFSGSYSLSLDENVQML